VYHGPEQHSLGVNLQISREELSVLAAQQQQQQ